MAGMFCSICTPDEELFSGEITYANCPGADGHFGVLPNHEFFATTHGKDWVTVVAAGSEGELAGPRKFLLYNGAAMVYNNAVTVIGRYGVEDKNVNIEQVQQEIKNTEDHIRELEALEEPSNQEKYALKTARDYLDWCQYQVETL